MSTREHRIKAILDKALAPELLELRDESHLHVGHNAEAATTGETHYRLKITSATFNDLTRVAQHQMVMGLLADEFATGLHALALTTQKLD